MKFNAIVIGKGPAGITAAIYLARAKYSVAVIAADYGALARTERIENYYGFEKGVSGRELVYDGEQQAKRLGVTFFEGEVVGATYDGVFTVRTETESFSADVLVFATGTARVKPNIKYLDRFEGSGVSYCAVCDAFFFRDRPVAVLGAGEYAKSEVEELRHVASSVIVLTNGEEPTADFDVPVVKKKIDMLVADNGDFGLGGAVYEDQTGDKFEGLFIAIGRAGTADLAKKLGAVVVNGEVVVDENKATSVPGVYAAGDCIPGVKQVAKAVYDGMTAALSAIQYLRNKK